MQLSKEEVQGIMNTLAEMPFKLSAGLINFFQTKINEENKDDKDAVTS